MGATQPIPIPPNVNLNILIIGDQVTQAFLKTIPRSQKKVNDKSNPINFMHKTYPWKFFVFQKGLTDATFNEINLLIEPKIIDRNHPNLFNTVVLCLIDSISSEKCLNLIESLSHLSLHCHPFVIFYTKTQNDTETAKQVFLEKAHSFKNDYTFDIKQIVITDFKQQHFDFIKSKLYDIYNYHRNLDIENNIYPFYFNCVVTGKKCTGKSTLINTILGKKKAREGINNNGTKIFSCFKHEKYPIKIWDTPGIDNDSIEPINHLITLMNNQNNKIHLILHLLNPNCGDNILDIAFLNSVLYNNCPIFLVFTHCNNQSDAQNKILIFHNIITEIYDISKYLRNKNLSLFSIDNMIGVQLIKGINSEPFGMDCLMNKIHNYFQSHETVFNAPQALKNTFTQNNFFTYARTKTFKYITEMTSLPTSEIFDLDLFKRPEFKRKYKKILDKVDKVYGCKLSFIERVKIINRAHKDYTASKVNEKFYDETIKTIIQPISKKIIISDGLTHVGICAIDYIENVIPMNEELACKLLYSKFLRSLQKLETNFKIKPVVIPEKNQANNNEEFKDNNNNISNNESNILDQEEILDTEMMTEPQIDNNRKSEDEINNEGNDKENNDSILLDKSFDEISNDKS